MTKRTTRATTQVEERGLYTHTYITLHPSIASYFSVLSSRSFLSLSLSPCRDRIERVEHVGVNHHIHISRFLRRHSRLDISKASVCARAYVVR